MTLVSSAVSYFPIESTIYTREKEIRARVRGMLPMLVPDSFHLVFISIFHRDRGEERLSLSRQETRLDSRLYLLLKASITILSATALLIAANRPIWLSRTFKPRFVIPSLAIRR